MTDSAAPRLEARTALVAVLRRASTPSEGGGNEAGGSLANVQIDDTTVAIPISVAANICDVNVNALLAEQVRSGGATCEATSSAQAS